MENAYAQTGEQVLQHFEVEEHLGLNDAQVVASREKHGSNGMRQQASKQRSILGLTLLNSDRGGATNSFMGAHS